MKGTEFIAGLPEEPGAARERAIFGAVEAGAFRLEWSTITSAVDGHVAEIIVSTDALAIGDADDWVRVNLSHTTAQRVAHRFDAILPTTRLSDLIFDQAAVRLTPCIQKPDAGMARTSRMLRHHEEVEGKRGGRSGLCATVGKDWVVTQRLGGRPERAANYGWHDTRAPNGRLWQTLGLAHDRFHVDYSQVVRLVKRTLRVDGVPRDIVDVLRDPTLAALVSSEGPITEWRLAAVSPDPSSAPAPLPPPRPAPAVTVPRTLRRGSIGPDVAEWQGVLGVVADGVFGARTERATQAWQAARGLVADGIVGPATRAVSSGTLPRPPGAVSGDREYPLVRARNFRAAQRKSIDLVVIHTMEAVEKPHTAEAVAAWFAGPNAPMASAHYCVDVDSVVQCVLEKDVAFHAPGANHNGIGVEHAGFASQSGEDWADDYSETLLRRSAALTAALCARYGVPIVFVDAAGLLGGVRGITTHRAVSVAFRKSTHTDPGLHFPFEHYLELVREFSLG